MSDSTDATLEFLAQHPRMLGVLFAAFVLLSSASTAAAQGGIYINNGP